MGSCKACNGTGRVMRPMIGPAGGKGTGWLACTCCNGTGRFLPSTGKKDRNFGIGFLAPLIVAVGMSGIYTSAGDKPHALILIGAVAFVVFIIASKRR
jgi:uncharacterized membrane protein YccC